MLELRVTQRPRIRVLILFGKSYSTSSGWFEGRKTRFQPQTGNGKRFLLSVYWGVSTLADVSAPILGLPHERANALRALGAEVVVGDLTRAGDVAHALAGCQRM